MCSDRYPNNRLKVVTGIATIALRQRAPKRVARSAITPTTSKRRPRMRTVLPSAWSTPPSANRVWAMSQPMIATFRSSCRS